MTEQAIYGLFIAIGMVGRLPRILERWKAPLLRGPDWFFNVQVPPGFYERDGADLLRRYRLRLFRPWLLELPILALLGWQGRWIGVLIVMAVVGWITRANYYAARQSAELEAKPYACDAEEAVPTRVVLSLQPRNLRAYTQPWIEALIALMLGAAGARYVWLMVHDAGAPLVRGTLAVLAVVLYLQFGLLLLKAGFVRARSAAPAVNAEQYLEWRECLRRLSTNLCDATRLMLAPMPLLISWQIGAGSSRLLSTAVILLVSALAVWFEWSQRQKYLQVARETRPAPLLVLPDLPDAAGILCFRPAVPMLLLNGPGGYTV